MATQGRHEEGLALLREAIAGLKATQSTMIFMHYQLALLADAALAAGDVRSALTAATEGIAIAEATGERFYLAELHRLAGVASLRIAVKPATQGRRSLERAIELARQQGAALLERKANASLAEWFPLPARGKGT